MPRRIHGWSPSAPSAAADAEKNTRPGLALFRDRERISAPILIVLLACALLPLMLVTLRLVALVDPAPSGLVLIGDWLNRNLTLSWVQAGDRDVVLYILLLPLAALLTALTRLTLGIRVLGFRAILIAIGFHEIGPLPSLLLILVIAGTVVTVRPLMRRAGMPLFARVAVILCIVAATMVAGLLGGSWLGSATLWTTAFFPVVILAMLAESVADTVARENLAVAAWRTGSTILLAAIIAGLGQLTPLRELALACPELVLTQLALIVFVSEFLDLRLLEPMQARLTDGPAGPSTRGTVVIARNRFGEPPLARRTPAAPKRYRRAGLQQVVDGLRDHGLRVRVAEGDDRLPQCLREEHRRCQASGGTPLVVLNLAGGVHGAARLAQVPVLCEMLGVPCTGPAPQAAALLDDRDAQLRTLAAAGLTIPQRLTLTQAEAFLDTPGSAITVRPRLQADHRGRRVRHRRDLQRALIQQTIFGETLIEAQREGRQVSAVLLWRHAAVAPEVLPLVEGGSRAYRACRNLTAAARSAAEDAARRAAQALGCRDLARVDLHLDDDGAVTVLQVAAIELPRPGGAVTCAAAAAGLSVGDLALQVVSRAIACADDGLTAACDATPRYASPHLTKENTACATSASFVTA